MSHGSYFYTLSLIEVTYLTFEMMSTAAMTIMPNIWSSPVEMEYIIRIMRPRNNDPFNVLNVLYSPSSMTWRSPSSEAWSSLSAKSESVDEGRSRSGYIIGSSVGSRNKNSSAAIIVMPDATKIHASVCWMMATPVTTRLSTTTTCMQMEMSAYFLYIYFSSSSSSVSPSRFTARLFSWKNPDTPSTVKIAAAASPVMLSSGAKDPTPLKASKFNMNIPTISPPRK